MQCCARTAAREDLKLSKTNNGGALELLLNAFIVWPIKLVMFMLGMAVIVTVGILAFAPLQSWGKDIQTWGSKVFVKRR
jgi:hypothetical protein